jgi:hypothetical protein
VECYRHPGVMFQTMCGGCRRPMCKECLQVVNGRASCPECARDDGATAVPGASSPAAAAFDLGSGVMSGTAGAVAAALSAPVSYARLEDATPLSLRLMQGVGWGVLFGQWWTLWTVIWNLVGVTQVRAMSNVEYALFYAFFGAVVGGTIAVLDADVCLGAKLGIGIGVVACLVETALAHSSGALFYLLWYFFTGRFIGRQVARRLQQGTKELRSCRSEQER